VNDPSRPDRVAAGTIGQALPRKEDLRLLTGAGRFSDDFNMPGRRTPRWSLALSARAHLRVALEPRARDGGRSGGL